MEPGNRQQRERYLERAALRAYCLDLSRSQLTVHSFRRLSRQPRLPAILYARCYSPASSTTSSATTSVFPIRSSALFKNSTAALVTHAKNNSVQGAESRSLRRLLHDLLLSLHPVQLHWNARGIGGGSLRRTILNAALAAVIGALHLAGQTAQQHGNPAPDAIPRTHGRSAPAVSAAQNSPQTVFDATKLGSPVMLDKGWRVGITTNSSTSMPARYSSSAMADLPNSTHFYLARWVSIALDSHTPLDLCYGPNVRLA